MFDTTPAAGHTASGSQRPFALELPIEIYGLEFQDLRLPTVPADGERADDIFGQFTLPAGENRGRVLRLDSPTPAKQIQVVSTVTNSASMPTGAPVGELVVHFVDGRSKAFLIRIGSETCAWNRRIGDCRIVVKWRKRLALVGSQGYPEAWQDFEAALYQASFQINSGVPIQAVELKRTGSTGDFSVWAVRLEPKYAANGRN